ncbi:hypothetical protein B1C78_13980 [Thioalkalivibrio denitrificans]|uniref:Uncharacterized protein n=1 Tax=Thioalkalivibrio denitrificans TaxID=108003 RepID=A0A1V3NCL2_9GAMM|nr:hypothetical protein [Thioalkalivibrio denitrificans]OOG22781.1 hypothetical protein B1C78_13980 [Thioalkalivibrio denitrificans]
MSTEILHIWSASPALSLAIWLVIAIILLYLGRPHAHQLLRGTGRAIYGSARLAAASIRQLEKRVMARNRDVLLAMGREASEKAIERDFTRVNTIIERDLGHYPALHRKLADTVQKVEADYRAATEDAPLPPAWAEVIETLSALPGRSDPAVAKILDDIREAVDQSHDETLAAYRKSAHERHRILNGMQPHWRSLNGTMEKVHRTITGLEDRARAIDAHMANYESMRKAEDRAVHALTASSLTQFFIATVVLIIAAFGGLINFHLIALPMSEMVGGASYIGSVRASDVAALVIVLLEITMGLFLLESLQITRLFPMIGSMDDRMRKRMAIAAFTILFILASIESSLAYMRDLLALDREALSQSLAGASVAEAQFRWIPSVAQMVLGFVLPFALAFVAIPLEAFVHSLRTVLGLLALAALRALRLTVRIVGGTANHLSKMLVSLYDLFIMLPLGIERIVRENRTGLAHREADGTDAGQGETPTDGRGAPRGRRRKGPAGEIDDDAVLAAREV